MNLANKYRPHTWEDMTEQKLIVDILKNMCEAETLNNRNFLLTGPAGCGKAQPLTSKVLTTNRGFIKMGDIKVGDAIYTHTGAIALVHSIHPQGVRDIYQIVLEDDTVIEVSDEHNNLVEFVIHTSIGNAGYVQDVISTKTLFNLFESQKEFECYIPSPLNCDQYNIEHLSSAELDMFAHRAFKDRWRIKSVTFNRQEECQCIYVAHSDHTYISDNFIVTHNTTLGRIMADVINSGVGDPIEIDAASHNGVDSMREIVSQAQIYPIGSKYKVFIIDECFSGDTLVRTSNGEVPISEITPGTTIYNLSGTANVSKVFCNEVKVENLVCVHLRNQDIITTRNHLFFTEDGWIAAKDMKPQDYIFNFKEVSNLRSFFPPYKACALSGPDVFIALKNNNLWEVSSKPRLVPSTTDTRCGWCIPDIEVPFAMSRISHIDYRREVLGVESFNVNKNLTLFQPHFDVSLKDTDTVTMYDLEVEGHPSYFADDALVHNCHALSNAAWQTFLKTLEDGPAKSLFVLCTTDPERIPATILSRVQVFQLSKISLDGIHKRLIHVLDSEIAEGQQLTYEDAAVNLIAKLANGGMRNALTLLDKVLAYSSDVTSKNVVDALDLPNYSDFFDLLSAYAKKDNAAISSIITKVYNSGINFHKWFEAFHAFVIQIVIYIYQQDIGATTIPEYFSEKIAPYTTAHAVVCLKLANTLVKLNYEMKSTQYQKELALTHLLFAKT